MENGLREDELVAMELGANALADLTEVQQQYVEKVKEKLAKVRESQRHIAGQVLTSSADDRGCAAWLAWAHIMCA
jgi:hypothetical protein